MGILHLVNQVSALESCRSVARSGDVVLLIEEGVVAAADDQDRPLLVLREDLEARDLRGLGRNVQLVDRNDFVNLVVRCQPIISWR